VAASILISPHSSAELLNTVEALHALAAEWRSIWQMDRAATPFQHPDWLIPWTVHVWRGGELRVVAIREEAKLVGLVPFFLWGYGSGNIRLSLLGSGISDYLDAIGEVRGNVQTWIGSNSEWDVCDFQDIRPASPLLAGLPQAEATVCPVLQLEGSMDAQLARADAKLRRSLRTAENRLRAAGRVEFVRADTSNCEALLDRLFALHNNRWNERGETGMFSTTALRAFHHQVVRRFSEEGILRLYGLLLNGECIAVQYNFAAKSRVYAYQAGFDPAWGHASPGSVLLAHSIEDAIREDAYEFDFLRHAENFKYAWGARDTFVYHVVIPRK
jgi:CelD/BcsL family acetyltransferase involved in cellulose biosynthesis